MRVKFFSAIRGAAGKPEILLRVKETVSVKEALERVIADCGPAVRKYLFSGDALSNNLVLCLNGEIIRADPAFRLRDEDELYLFLPLSGG